MAQVTMTGPEYIELMEEMRALKAFRDFHTEMFNMEVRDGVYIVMNRDENINKTNSPEGKVYRQMATDIMVENLIANPEACSIIVTKENYAFCPLERLVNQYYSWSNDDPFTIDLRTHPKWYMIVQKAKEFDETRIQEHEEFLAATKALEAMEQMEHDDVLTEAAPTQEDCDEEE